MASRTFFILLSISIYSMGLAQPRTHRLKAAPDTVVWGYYDASVPPVLTIDSGDVVDVEHMITGARLLRTLGVPEDAIRPDMEEMDEKVKQEGPHLLVGPVAVRGAEAGDVLEVRIVEMGVVDPWAVNLFAPGGGALPKLFPYQGSKFVRLDLERKVALFAPGIEIPLRPFFGSIGVAPPPLSGPHRKRSPRLPYGEPRQQRAHGGLDALHSSARQRRPAVHRRWSCRSG